MRLLSIVLFLSASLLAGDWVMFSDGKDTYIYSNTTGEIYIRYHMGSKNYEDVFVKMPRGTQPNEIVSTQNSTPKSGLESERLKEMRLNALKKSQEMLNAVIE